MLNKYMELNNMDKHLYNNFNIGMASCNGTQVFTVRPSKYAVENWGHLGMDFWFDASSLKEAENVINGFVDFLDS